MAGKRIVIGGYMPALDLTGAPVAGAKMRFYENETTTLATVYTSAALNVAHPNPVIADAAGQFPSIFADEGETFSVEITDSNDLQISGLRNRDGVQPTVVYAQEATDNAAEIVFEADGDDASIRSLQEKVRDLMISPADYGAAMDGSTDDTAAMQAAIDYAATRPGSIIDLGGRAVSCGAVTIPDLTRGLSIKNGRINVRGDVVWLKGAVGATSITFLTLDNLFIDCSAQTTATRRTIDFSLFSYCSFYSLWFYNNNLGTQINLYAAGNGTVGPYYNVFDLIYSGGGLAGVRLEATALVANTVNNNTFRGCRFNPGGPGRYGAIVGQENQQNRFLDCVFEDTVGGIGIDDDGIGTQIIATRFEGLTTAMNFGANAAGGADIGCYFDSNTAKRAFAGSSASLHNIVAPHNGNGSTDEAILCGGQRVGGGLRLRGAPGFPADLVAGEGHAYASATLGGVYGGWGSTNDLTFLNRLGQIAAVIPHDTTNFNIAGASSVGGALSVGSTLGVTGAGTFGGAVTGTGYQVGANQVLGARNTGWTAMTGTASKGALATYTAPDIEATYTEATIQALADAVQALSHRVKAHDDAMFTHGQIGA